MDGRARGAKWLPGHSLLPTSYFLLPAFMLVSDFNYDLPEELIAQQPPAERGASRMLVLGRTSGEFRDAVFADLPTLLQPGDLLSLLINARAMLTEKDFKVDYIEIADAETLEPVHQWNGKQNVIALAAAFLHEVRLIDNMILN